MANNSQNVSFGKPKATGGVWYAPAGTTVPTDATTALGNDFVSVGYISEDGLVDAIETDVTDISAWGGDVVLTGQTSFKQTFTVNLLETNADALNLYYGEDNVTSNGGGSYTVNTNGAPLPEVVAVFETVMTGGRIKRIVVPHALIADRSGEITYTDGDAVTYPVVFTALPDSNGNTSTAHIATVAQS